MGSALEFNWQIVVRDELPQPNVDETRNFTKEGYHTYPVSDEKTQYELPVIVAGELIGMGIVTMQVHVSGKTHLKYKLIKRFPEGETYTELYKEVKE